MRTLRAILAAALLAGPAVAAAQTFVDTTQVVVVEVPVHVGTGAVRVRAKVVGADGQEVAGGRIKLLEHQAGPPDRLLASYDPPQLPPGEYHLQVTLTDGSGASRTSTTPFVVGTGRPAGA